MALNPLYGLRLSPEDRAKLLRGGLLDDSRAVGANDSVPGSETDKAARQGYANLASTGYGLRAFGRGLIGDSAGATQDATTAQKLQQDAALNGPRVQGVEDIHGVGDAAEYARNTILSQGPNLAASLIGGAGGAGVGKRVVLQRAKQVALDAAEGAAARMSDEAAVDAATKASKGITPPTADIARARIAQRAAAAAKPTAEAAVRGAQVGGAVGAGASSVALEAGQLAPDAITADSPDDVQTRMFKVGLGSLAAGSIDAYPAFRLLNKSGILGAIAKPEVQALSRKIFNRIAREAGHQAVVEGGTELAQTVIEHASQKWIDNRLDMLSPAAMSDYINSTVAGGTLGLVSGGIESSLHLPAAARQSLIERRALKPATGGSTGSAEGDVAKAKDTLRKANDDSIDLSDIDNEPEFTFPGQQPSPNPEDVASMAGFIPANVFNIINNPKTSPEVRQRLTSHVMGLAMKRDAADAESAGTKAGTSQRFLEAALGDDAPHAVTGLTKLFGGTLKPDWTPEQSLLSAVSNRPSLSDDEVRAVKAVDGIVSQNPALKQSLVKRYSSLTSATDEDAQARRADAAKTGGVLADPKVLRSMVSSEGTARHFSDRVLRSALKDLARSGDAQATEQLGHLQDKLQSTLGDERSPAVRNTRADSVYAGFLKQLGNKNPELLSRVREQLQTSYNGMTPVDAARATARDQLRPEHELQVVDKDGNEAMVDIPHMISYLRSLSGEAAVKVKGVVEVNDKFMGQLAENYGKALQLLSSDNAELRMKNAQATEAAMNRDSLVLYQNPKSGDKVTLGDLKARGYFKSQGGGKVQLANGKVLDVKDDTALINQKNTDFDPNDLPQQEAQGEGDGRTEGGAPYQISAKRPAAPQADVIEALAGAPPDVANARETAKTEKSFERDNEGNDIEQLKQQIAELGTSAAAMTPDERKSNDVAGQMTRLRQSLRAAYNTARTAKGKREVLKASLLRKADTLATIPSRGHEPPVRAVTGMNDVAARRVARRAAAMAAKNVSPAATVNAEAAAKIAANKARYAAEKAARKATRAEDRVTDELSPAALHEIAKSKGLDANDDSFKELSEALTGEAHLDNMDTFQLQALRDFLTPMAKGAPKANRVLAFVDNMIASPRPSTTTLNSLARAMLDHFGIDTKINVVLLDPAQMSSEGFGSVQAQADGSYQIVLRSTLRGQDLISTLSHEIGHVIKWDAFDNLRLKEQQEVLKAFDAWRAQQHEGITTVRESLESRATAARQQLLSDAGAGLGKALSEADDSYLLLFDEWFADHAARYITTQADTTSVIGKFFADVMEKLRALAVAFGLKAQPDAAVKKLLDGMRPSKGAVVAAKYTDSLYSRIAHDKIPDKITTAEAVAAVHAFTNPTTRASTLSLAAIFEGLPKGARKVLTAVVNRNAVAEKLRSLVQDPVVLHALDAPEIATESRVAVAYELAQSGKLNLAEIQGPVRQISDRLSEIMGVMTGTQYFEQFLADTKLGVTNNPRRYNLFGRTAKAAQANVLGKALARMESYYHEAVAPLASNIYSEGVGDKIRSRQLPAMTALALKFKVLSGERFHDDPGLVPARQRMDAHFTSQIGKAFENLDQVDMDALHEVFMGTAELSTLNDEQKAAHAALRQHFTNIAKYLQDAGVELQTKKNYFPIVMKDDAELGGMHDEFTAFFAKNFDTQMRDKLVHVFGRGMDVKTTKGKAKYDAMIADIKKKSADEVAEIFYRMAMGRDDGQTPEWAQGSRPSFRYMNEQLMDFVLDGTKEQLQQFSNFREPNLASIVTRYNSSATKRAEFQRRFPDADSLQKYFDDAKKQGASDDDLKLMHDYVDVMMGSYGLEYPQALKSLFQGIDKFTGTKLADNPALARKIQGYIMVYQNVRLLGLATLSSVTDSLGIAVRSGRFVDLFAAYRDTFKALRKDDGPDGAWAMAQDLGVVETAVTNEILQQAHGGPDLSPSARRVNDYFFEAIGLTRWTQATRVAATTMGHRFLLRHANGEGVSQRYLDELGLKKSDITSKDGEYVDMHTDDAERDARVRNAMIRFIDESILRPDASQRPLWMSDPNYRLFAQYKSFTYAFYSTIVKRMMHEARNNNYQPLLLALAYVPIMMVAEIAREFIKHGDNGDPLRANWGPTDYAWQATQRTGLLGPREYLADAFADPGRGNIPGASFLGPTVAQARSWTSHKPMNKVAVEALPLSSVTKNYIEPEQPKPVSQDVQ